MKSRLLLAIALFASGMFSVSAHAEVTAYLAPTGTRAIDAKGVLRNGNDYPRKHPPWLDDRVRSVSPNYPFWERANHHKGVGWFQLILDLKTGAVAEVRVAKSTGFKALDRSAIAALRQWRWKPGKWREIHLPVSFEIGPPLRHLPAGASPLSP